MSPERAPAVPGSRRGLLLAGALIGLLALFLGGPPRSVLEADGPVDGVWRLAVVAVPLVLGLGWAPLRILGWARGAAGIGFALTTAPLVWFGLAAATLSLGFRFAEAGQAGVVLGSALLLVAWLFERRRAPQLDGGEPAFPSADRLALLAWILFVALCLTANPVLFWRSDAWFHAAVTYRLDVVGLPLDDPFFGGQPLGYFWAFHAGLGLLAAAAGVDPFLAGAAWSTLAAAATGFWLLYLARRLGGGRAAAWVLPVAVLALNPLGWLAWIGRGLFGEWRGSEALFSVFRGGALGGLEAVSWNYPHPSVGYLFDKFLLVTAFGTAMAAVLAAAACIRERQRLGSWASFGCSAVVLATALVLHPVAGIALVVGWIAAVAFVFVRRDLRGGVWPLVAGLLLAALLAGPYLAALSETRGTGGWQIQWNLGTLWTWIASGGLLAVLAGRAVVSRDADPELWVFAVLPATMVILGLGLVVLPANETKFFQLGALAAAVPAAVGWTRLCARWSKGLARLLLFAGGLPTTLLVTACFLLEQGQDVAGTYPLDSARRSAYEWLAATAPARALVLADAGQVRAVRPDAPVYARHALVWGGAEFARKWGYAGTDAAVRRTIQETALAAGLDSLAAARLRAWTGPDSAALYVWRSGDADTTRLRRAGWRVAWRNGAGAWWKWLP